MPLRPIYTLTDYSNPDREPLKPGKVRLSLGSLVCFVMIYLSLMLGLSQ